MTQKDYDQQCMTIRAERKEMQQHYEEQFRDLDADIDQRRNMVLSLQIEINNLRSRKKELARCRMAEESVFSQRLNSLGRDFHPYYEEARRAEMIVPPAQAGNVVLDEAL